MKECKTFWELPKYDTETQSEQILLEKLFQWHNQQKKKANKI